MEASDQITPGDEPPPDIKHFEVTKDPPDDEGNADAELKTADDG